MGTPFVIRRLNALRDELKREEFDVAAANRALKVAVEEVVLNPESALLEVQWREAMRQAQCRSGLDI